MRFCTFRPGVGEDRIPKVASLEIVGPFSAAGVSITPSRQRIFVSTWQRSRGADLRDKDSQHDRAPRVSPAGDRRRFGSAARFLPRGQEER